MSSYILPITTCFLMLPIIFLLWKEYICKIRDLGHPIAPISNYQPATVNQNISLLQACRISACCSHVASTIVVYRYPVLILTGDTLGVMRTSAGLLHFFINGEDQGIAANSIPSRVYAVVDIYGKCTQVTINAVRLLDTNQRSCKLQCHYCTCAY